MTSSRVAASTLFQADTQSASRGEVATRAPDGDPEKLEKCVGKARAAVCMDRARGEQRMVSGTKPGKSCVTRTAREAA